MRKVFIIIFISLMSCLSGCFSNSNYKVNFDYIPDIPRNMKFVKVMDYGWNSHGNATLGMGNGGAVYIDSETGIKYLVVYYGKDSRTMCRLWSKNVEFNEKSGKVYSTNNDESNLNKNIEMEGNDEINR